MSATEDNNQSLVSFLGDLNERGTVCTLEEIEETVNPMVLGKIKKIQPPITQSPLQPRTVLVYYMKEIYSSDYDYDRQKFKVVFVGDAATSMHARNLQTKDYLAFFRPKMLIDSSYKRNREFYKRLIIVGQWPEDDVCSIYVKKTFNDDWTLLVLKPNRSEINQQDTATEIVQSNNAESVIVVNSVTKKTLKRKSLDDDAENKKKTNLSGENTEAPFSSINQNAAIQDPFTTEELIQNSITSSNSTNSSEETVEELRTSLIQNVISQDIVTEKSPLEKLIQNDESSTFHDQPDDEEEFVDVENIDESSLLSSLNSISQLNQQIVPDLSSFDKENVDIKKSSPSISEKSTNVKINKVLYFRVKQSHNIEKSVLCENSEIRQNYESLSSESQVTISLKTLNLPVAAVNQEIVISKNVNDLIHSPLENIEEVLTKWPKSKSSVEFIIKTCLVITLPPVDEWSHEDSMFSFIRGYCNYCTYFIPLTKVLWLFENSKNVPLCPHCRNDGKIHNLVFKLIFKLLLKDENDLIIPVFLIDRNAENFLGCTASDLCDSAETRRKAIDFLNSYKNEEENGKTLTVKITPIQDNTEKWQYHVTDVQVS